MNYIASSESWEPKRFVRCWNNVKENIFKSNNQISSAVTTRTWFLSTEWTRTWSSIGIQMKKWWWFPFVWMVDVNGIQCAWILYRFNKDKGNDPLPLLAFWRHVVNEVLSEIFKGRLSSSHLGTRNIPSDVCYDDTEHMMTQAYTEPLETSKRKCFCVNS